MFSEFVIAYLFLGGTGGGALVVLALLECANARRRFSRIRITSGFFSGPGPAGLIGGIGLASASRLVGAASAVSAANTANVTTPVSAPGPRIRTCKYAGLDDDNILSLVKARLAARW